MRQRFVDRDRSARETIGQRRALDELHHERTYAVSLSSGAFLEAVELRDVLVVQRCEDLCLTLKPRNAFGIVSEVVRENLDRDVAAQLRVACAIHLAHPTRTKVELYLVHADTRARSKGHFAGLSHDVKGVGLATRDHRHGDRADRTTRMPVTFQTSLRERGITIDLKPKIPAGRLVVIPHRISAGCQFRLL